MLDGMRREGLSSEEMVEGWQSIRGTGRGGKMMGELDATMGRLDTGSQEEEEEEVVITQR